MSNIEATRWVCFSCNRTGMTTPEFETHRTVCPARRTVDVLGVYPTAQMDLRQFAAEPSRELDTLRLRLAAIECERDEAWRAVNDQAVARLHTLRDEMLTATVEALGAVRAERDAAIQRAATAEADRDALCLKLEAERELAAQVVRAQWENAEAETAEAIAVFLERQGNIWGAWSGQIRAGAWRGKEGA